MHTDINNVYTVYIIFVRLKFDVDVFDISCTEDRGSRFGRIGARKIDKVTMPRDKPSAEGGNQMGIGIIGQYRRDRVGKFDLIDFPTSRRVAGRV